MLTSVPLPAASVASDVLHSAFQSSISMIINDSYNCSKITFCTGEGVVLIGELMLLSSVTAVRRALPSGKVMDRGGSTAIRSLRHRLLAI